MSSVFTRAFHNLITQNMRYVQRSSTRTSVLVLSLFLSLLALTGCQSAGKQYVFPTDTEPAATAVGDAPFFLVNIDHTGCYWGRTLVDGKKQIRLTPEVLTTLSHEGHLMAPYPVNELMCRTFLNFTPRRGEHYFVKREDVPTRRNAEGKTVIGSCNTAIWRQQPGGEMERVPNEQRPKATRRSFGCLMPEKPPAEKP